MGLPRNNRLCETSLFLKKHMTKAERRLWFGFLRGYLLSFTPQKIIGPYIVDFFCNKVRLSIEVDGSHHREEPYQESDIIRTTYLQMLEIHELRFWNSDIWDNFDGVCETIHNTAQKRRNDVIDLPLSTLQRKK